MALEFPVLTLNHEIGSRYEYDLFEDENLDYLTLDGYQFNRGYAQLSQAITKALSFKFNFNYNMKTYELTNTLDNNSFGYQAAIGWQIIKNLDMDIGFRYTTRDFLNSGTKDLEGMSPGLELRFTPVKLLHLGFNYNLFRENYLGSPGDYLGNRFNIWYEHRIIPQVNIRLRYRIKNRDFDNNSPQRSDSFKHSFAATVKIDLNKSKVIKLSVENNDE
jgi:hypothetical protein